MEGGGGMKVKGIKAKVAAKIAKAKAKVAAKCGDSDAAKKLTEKVATLVALALVIVGCASTGEQPARSQTMHNDFKDCIVIVTSKCSVSNRIVRAEGTQETPSVELFTQTQQNEGSETISPHASPTNTTDVDAALDVPVNKMNSGTSAAGGAAEKLLGAGADWLSSKIGTGGAATASTAAQANAKSAACADGSCSKGSCTDGSCTLGGGDCKDGSCSDK